MVARAGAVVLRIDDSPMTNIFLAEQSHFAESKRAADKTCRLVTLGCKVNQYETRRAGGPVRRQHLHGYIER